MRWLRCCCCWPPAQGGPEDSSSLVVHQAPEQRFYVPRRHSSFQPGTSNGSHQSHSESGSSSEGEEGPEHRARCWSNASATEPLTPGDARKGCSEGMIFERHVLDEITENEPQQEQLPADPPKPRDEAYGHISFRISYDESEQKLSVFVHQAFGLPQKAEEPYPTFVRASLGTSSSLRRGSNHCQVARSVGKNRDPSFQEEIVLQANRSKWKAGAHLRLSVFDSEREGRHDAIGHALFLLDKLGNRAQECRLPLTPMTVPVGPQGQVLVSLLYSRTQSHLAVHAIKGRRLLVNHKRHPACKGEWETFCKVTLSCGGEKVKTCRSQPILGPDPFFNFHADFVLPPQYLHNASIIVTVATRSALGRAGLPVGRTSPLGPYQELGDGSSTQWGRMLQDEKQVVQWRTIYL